MILLFVAGHSWAQNEDSCAAPHSFYEPSEGWLESYLAFPLTKYRHFRYPEIGTFSPLPLNLKFVTGSREWSMKDSAFVRADFTLADTLPSFYFRSTYLMLFARWTNLLPWEAPPSAFVVAIDGEAQKAVTFDPYPFGGRIGEDRPDGSTDVSHNIEYVQADFRKGSVGYFDKSSAVTASYEAITLLSWEYPVYFIDSLEQVEELSNILEDNAFWEQPPSESQVSVLAHSSMKMSDLLAILNWRPIKKFYDDSEFTVLRDSVPPLSISFQPGDSSMVVNCCTWSPIGGTVKAWEIAFKHNSIQISYRQLGLFFGFSCTL